MKATGIVVEYNPFHNGHKYHLQKTKELNPNNIIIAVMSGDFVQRGEPSIIDRWTKTKMALANGVDLVIELPVFYSSQSAEIFAKGAVGILEELKCESMVFGSESGKINELKRISTLQESEEFKIKLKERLKSGDSYPTAHSSTMKEILGESELNSNDILGLEYIKAIRYWKSSIIPMTLKREKVGYHDTNIVGDFASATKIREHLKKNEEISSIVTQESFNTLKEYSNFTYMENFYPFIRYELIKNSNNLSDIQDMEIGFENRLLENAIKSINYDEFFKSISNRRYTTGRVQRVLTHTLLALTTNITEEVKKSIPYVRVLGFNSKGREYLSYLKKFDNSKIITSYKKMNENFSPEVCSLIEFNERSSQIYRLINNYNDYKSPIIFKEENNE
ncbi:nucleotidyltransferase [Fusobacterium mortiferum]|uniref:tRNA(Met) cytidine acetate ligase n=1 Tax=Fusobacterium mortiferum TaxID=850 RepID=A0ABS2G2R1_FUSMR|nr:nucleotidyltransferase [Fusobacterium mortiferum]MBM6690563.1 nucleotidyltransferase [Fusobacterium mortiferum]MBM6875035.1 nucleotidyltransferase [Fusobacterium mortiferum]